MSSRMVLALILIPVATAAAAELEIINSSERVIEHLYLARIGENVWGPDELGEKLRQVLRPGASLVIPALEAAAYDIRIVDDDGRECELHAVTIETTTTIELTDAKLADCAAAN